MQKITIKTTPAFDCKAKRALTAVALEELYDYLEDHPEKGDIIPGTHGVRKLRWKTGKDNKGKSGGIRVLYHYSKNILILLITFYEKSEKENITQLEKNELKKLIPQLVTKYKEELLHEGKN